MHKSFSKQLVKVGSIDIGRSFLVTEVDPDLCIAVIFACFRQRGKETSETDELKRLLIVEEIIVFKYFYMNIGTELSLHFFILQRINHVKSFICNR